MTSLKTLFAAGTLMLLGASVASAQVAGVTCKDGTASAGGRGACSGHGGILTAEMKAKMDADAKVAAAKAKANAKVAKAEVKEATASKANKAEAKADVKVAKAEAKADVKAAKTEAKVDAKAAKTEAKVDAKEAKADAKADMAELHEAKGATAECKDHTYSHAKTHQGACSSHGGVAKFMSK